MVRRPGTPVKIGHTNGPVFYRTVVPPPVYSTIPPSSMLVVWLTATPSLSQALSQAAGKKREGSILAGGKNVALSPYMYKMPCLYFYRRYA